MKETESVSRWKDRISVAEKYRERMEEEKGWKRYRQMYKGIYDVEINGRKVPVINEVFSYIQTLMSGLYFRDPYLAVNAKRSGSIRGAKIIEAAVNYYWRELGIKQEMEIELIDTGLIGHGWHKTGIIANEEGGLAVPKLYSSRVSYQDMIFNIAARRVPQDCSWMAQKILLPVDEVKKLYKGLSEIKGGPHPLLKKDDYNDSMFVDDIQFAVLYEIWDRAEGKIRLLCQEHNKWLEEKDWPKELETYAFDFLNWNPIPDEPYPLSDIAPLEPQILEKIKLFFQMLNHVKRWNRQLLMQTGLMDDTELDKFETGADGQVILTAKDPNTGTKVLDYPPLPTDYYLIMDRLDQMIRVIGGLPEFAKGGTTQSKTRTLGELQLMAQGATARSDRKLDCVETHCENIAKKLIAHIKSNFSAMVPQIVKITGEETQEVLEAFGEAYDPNSGTVQFSADDITGEYDVEVKAGSTLPLNRETRKAVMGQILETASKLAALPTLPPFIQVLVQEILRDYDIKSLQVAFDEQQKGLAEQQAGQAEREVAELEKVKAEAAKRQAQAKEIGMNMGAQIGGMIDQARGAVAPAPAEEAPVG